MQFLANLRHSMHFAPKMKIRLKIAVLLAARTLGLFRLSRYFTASRLRILCYHGGMVGDEGKFNPKLFCSENTLHARMKWMLDKGFHFVTLDDGMKQQSSPGNQSGLRAVVTFDDGWHSTASRLLPVLSRLQIPSTLYLSTENFLKGWPILDVTVRYTIWKAGQKSVTIHGWGGGLDGEYDFRNAGERNRLADGVATAIARSANGRAQACEAVHRFAQDIGVPAAALQLDSRRFDYVTHEELAAMPAQGCGIESHGHVHKYPKDKPLEFAEDLRTCENVIVGLGFPKPRHYCYPSGAFSAEASPTLSKLGIRSATTCIPGLVDRVAGDRCHYLPRFLDGEDVHPLQFEAEMSGFSDLMRSGIRFAGRVRHFWQTILAEPVHADA